MDLSNAIAVPEAPDTPNEGNVPSTVPDVQDVGVSNVTIRNSNNWARRRRKKGKTKHPLDDTYNSI